MNMSSETLRALYGTWRIARGDANGLTFFDFSLNGFWRSFLAAIIVFPAFAFLRWHDLLDAPEDFPVGRYMTVEVVAYVIKWLAFPVLMYQVMPILGRTERYIGFITVYNWSSVLQMAVYLVALLLGVLFPMLGPGGFVMVAVIAMLVYGVYIARLTLSVPIPTASAIVMADFLLSLSLIHI